MIRQRPILLIVVFVLAITLFYFLWGRPALRSDDTKFGGSTPPLKAGQTCRF
ncbi:MAG: hypothetical protein GX033_01825 [Firmicutes bacterium]|nr:hypothetical protein [Bacillota bacterium]